MHPCPCCGYRTLPERGTYELCPVCWWEDDGSQPWEGVDGPNGRSLLEAQQEFLAETRAYRRRGDKVRAPRHHEARDPAWRPLDRTPDLLARVERAERETRLRREADEARWAREVEEDPEGPLRAYNDAVAGLRVETPALSHRQTRARLRALVHEHGLPFDAAEVEMLVRTMRDEDYYRGRPLRVGWWLLRHGRLGSVRRHLREVRTGVITFAG